MGIFNIFNKKKKQQDVDEVVQTMESSNLSIDESKDENGIILLEQLSSANELDENQLIEIKDSSVLARLNNLIPNVVTLGATVGNVVQPLYKVTLKKGGKLAHAKGYKKSIKRAFTQRENGQIKEHATLEAANKGVNATAAIMGIASMVVGQYYMSQVDTQLKAIKDSLSSISEFLDIQYQSKVASLMEAVYTISKFQISSIENEELRNRELNSIQQLRISCQELLNQAETKVTASISKEYNSYDDYEKIVMEVEKWFSYQTILTKLLHEIDSLDFTLHLGIKSKEQCFNSFVLHTNKLENNHSHLVDWHNKQCERLQINLDECRRKNKGFFRWLEKPISKINDKWNYVPIEETTINMIKSQTAEMEKLAYSDDNLFEEAVQIIAKEGKYYYLPTNLK